jgi:hypothetical protein
MSSGDTRIVGGYSLQLITRLVQGSHSGGNTHSHSVAILSSVMTRVRWSLAKAVSLPSTSAPNPAPSSDRCPDSGA